MLRILFGSLVVIMVVAFLLQAAKLYLRKLISKGRIIAVFVPPPGTHAIYGFGFEVIGDIQFSINLEGASRKSDRTLYCARHLSGHISSDLHSPVIMTHEQSLVIRRHFFDGTVVGFVPRYQTAEDSVHPEASSDEYAQEAQGRAE